MHRLLTTLTTTLLTGTLAGGLALAAPRRTASPVVPTQTRLTAEQTQYCKIGGELALTIAQARDHGPSIAVVLAFLRDYNVTHGLEAETHARLVRRIFHNDLVAPPRLQQAIEQQCLTDWHHLPRAGAPR